MPVPDLYNNSTYQGNTITDKIQNRLAELNKANPFTFSNNVLNTVKDIGSLSVQPVNNTDNSSTLSVYYTGDTIQNKIQNRLNELNGQVNSFALPRTPQTVIKPPKIKTTTPEIKQGVLANYPQALKETAISGLKAIPKIFFPAITNFVKKSTGIIGESLAYAIDPLVREQYKEGNQDILPNVSATSPTDMLKDTFAAGLEASIYKIIPSTLKISIVKRFGVGALQGVGFAVSQGLANDETPEQILDNAKTYGKYGAAIEVVAPYLLPLLKTELRNIPQGVKNTFKGLAQETSNVPVGLSIKGDEVGWKYNDKLRKELIKITNLAYTSLDSPVGAVIRHWEEKKLPTNSIIEQVKELIKKSKGNANKNLLELENKLKLPEIIGEVKPLAQEATKYKSAEELGIKINDKTKLLPQKERDLKIINDVISETDPQFIEGLKNITVKDFLKNKGKGHLLGTAGLDDAIEFTSQYTPEATKTLLRHEIGHKIYDNMKLTAKDIVWERVSGLDRFKDGMNKIVEKFSNDYAIFKENPNKLTSEVRGFFENISNEKVWDEIWSKWKTQNLTKSQLTDIWNKANKGIKESKQKVLNLRSQGKTFSEIGKELGYTVEKTRQIIQKLGEPFGKVQIGPMVGIGAGATGVLATLAALKEKNKEANAKTYAKKIASVKIPTSKELVPGEMEYNVITKKMKYKPLPGELKPATLTVYNPEKEQTDETPDIGGFSTKMEFGDVAVGNRNEYDKAKSKFSKDKTDTFIFIPELEKVKTPYGDGIFRVRDTMKITNDGKNMLDIFIPNAGSNTEKTVRNTPKATYAYLKI